MTHATRNTFVEEIYSLTCDSCGKTATKDDDIWEFQEFLRISSECGYGSVFQDMATIEADLCQECVQRLLGGFLRVIPHWSPIVPHFEDNDPPEIVVPDHIDEVE